MCCERGECVASSSDKQWIQTQRLCTNGDNEPRNKQTPFLDLRKSPSGKSNPSTGRVAA